MKIILSAIIATLIAMSGAGAAHADPNVPWEGGWCDSGDGTNVQMIRYQGTVFVCTPPGIWTRAGGLR